LSRPLRSRALGILDVHLLDLSIAGARIEHFEPLRPGSVWTVELPPAFGSLVLSARIVRSSAVDSNEHLRRHPSQRYESGLAFVGLTAEHQAILTRSLKPLAPGVNVGEGGPSP
jgi:hypothetical protein